MEISDEELATIDPILNVDLRLEDVVAEVKQFIALSENQSVAAFFVFVDLTVEEVISRPNPDPNNEIDKDPD